MKKTFLLFILISLMLPAALFARTKDFRGVWGKIVQIDGNRNAVKPIKILKLDPKTSKFVYQSTIAP